MTFLQPFANYNLGSGLSVGVSAEASGNWEADDTWTAPLLFSVSKVALLGKAAGEFRVRRRSDTGRSRRQRQLAFPSLGDVLVSTMTTVLSPRSTVHTSTGPRSGTRTKPETEDRRPGTNRSWELK